MMTILKNTIIINCPVADLFDYVTQPWLWHEWHPNSISATRPAEFLKVGDQFDEYIELKPMQPLAFTLKRLTHYQVIQVEPLQRWVVKGFANNGELSIEYEFIALERGTQFSRSLSFNLSGIYRLMMPLMSAYLKKTSVIALNHLKQKLEN